MAEKLCPFPDETGKRGACITHRCAFYIDLIGQDPQKGQPVQEWGCTFAFIPILLIENAKEVRQYAASVDAARNQANTDSSVVAASVVAMARKVAEAASSMRPMEPTVTHIAVEKSRGLLARLGFRRG